MGVSTDAILCCGIDLGEDLPQKFLDFLETEDGMDWGLDIGAYLAWCNGTEREEKDYPVEFVHHCSDTVTLYIIAVAGTVTIARRGCPEIIDDLHVDEKDIGAFSDWCKKHGIEGNPNWLLCSYWG